MGRGRRRLRRPGRPSAGVLVAASHRHRRRGVDVPRPVVRERTSGGVAVSDPSGPSQRGPSPFYRRDGAGGGGRDPLAGVLGRPRRCSERDGGAARRAVVARPSSARSVAVRSTRVVAIGRDGRSAGERARQPAAASTAGRRGRPVSPSGGGSTRCQAPTRRPAGPSPPPRGARGRPLAERLKPLACRRRGRWHGPCDLNRRDPCTASLVHRSPVSYPAVAGRGVAGSAGPVCGGRRCELERVVAVPGAIPYRTNRDRADAGSAGHRASAAGLGGSLRRRAGSRHGVRNPVDGDRWLGSTVGDPLLRRDASAAISRGRRGVGARRSGAGTSDAGSRGRFEPSRPKLTRGPRSARRFWRPKKSRRATCGASNPWAGCAASRAPPSRLDHGKRRGNRV